MWFIIMSYNISFFLVGMPKTEKMFFLKNLYIWIFVLIDKFILCLNFFVTGAKIL